MDEKFNIVKEEELKNWSADQLKKYIADGIAEGQKVLKETNDIQKTKDIVNSVKIAKAILEEKEAASEEPEAAAKKDVQTEKRSYLTQINNVLTRGVTTADIPLVDRQSKLKIKDTFDISDHVTNEETSKVTGNLPTLKTDEALPNVDELMTNPDLSQLNVVPDKNKYIIDTFRGQLGLSFEMYDDAFDTPAYVDGIGQSIIRNTKLKELVSKATATPISDKPALISAINGFDMGTLKLIANKQNLNVVGAMADQIIYNNGKVLYRLGGILVEAVEAPKDMQEALLFNQESTHIITRYVNYRLTDPSAEQSYYAKLLKITVEMGIILEEPVLSLSF